MSLPKICCTCAHFASGVCYLQTDLTPDDFYCEEWKKEDITKEEILYELEYRLDQSIEKVTSLTNAIELIKTHKE